MEEGLKFDISTTIINLNVDLNFYTEHEKNEKILVSYLGNKELKNDIANSNVIHKNGL